MLQVESVTRSGRGSSIAVTLLKQNSQEWSDAWKTNECADLGSIPVTHIQITEAAAQLEVASYLLHSTYCTLLIALHLLHSTYWYLLIALHLLVPTIMQVEDSSAGRQRSGTLLRTAEQDLNAKSEALRKRQISVNNALSRSKRKGSASTQSRCSQYGLYAALLIFASAIFYIKLNNVF